MMDHKNFSCKSNLPDVILVKNEIARTDLLKFFEILREFFTNII